MTAPAERELARRVGAAVAEVLGREPDPDTPFFDLGLTSLMLVRVRLRLERELDRPLGDATLFEHSSVAALTAHLAATGEPGAGSPAAPAAAPAPDGRVAVVGMAARLPGADDVERFWRNLRDGVCGVRAFAPGGREGRVPVGGVLDGAELFDAAYFGMSAREAELTDPAHRLFLECCAHALEDGGYAGPDHGLRVGVYAGGGMNLYGPRLPYYARHGMGFGDPSANTAREMQGLIGGQYDFLASRAAYRLGLTGAAVGVQTACSTGLVAVHLAVQSLLAGENDLALAGAAAVHLPQDGGYAHDPEFILSPSGVCRAFDAASDGTVGGNGVAVVLLKRLDRALADGDHVHAVILGSAVTNDGAAKAGFTAPGVQGHAEAARLALARAGVAPETVGYVEAHGTSTALGDPVEFEALSRAYRPADGRTGFCALGSVKPSVGHLDTCAGMAGLLKTVLMLRHGVIVPTVNATRPSPRLPWDASPFRLATQAREWRTEGGAPRRAGVSALGFGGTNAHVVLEEPPARPASPVPGRPVPVPVSARTARALREAARRLRDHLAAHPELSAADVHTTLALGRPHHAHRTVAHGRTAAELAASLDGFLRSPRPSAAAAPGPLVFAFSGQGAAVAGMARDLYAHVPAVREVLDTCEEIHRSAARTSLLDVLLDTGGAPLTGPVAQPAQFALQAALAALWRECGIEPALTLGHSLGEIAALYAAGAFPLADGLRFVIARGRLMAEGTRPGRMLAVAADAAAVRAVCHGPVEIAAVNGPRSVVLSGPPDAVEEAGRALEARGIVSRPLAVDRAFHSALIDPVLPELRAAAAAVDFAPLRLPCADGVRGEVLPAGTVLDAGHLVRQARRPVLFDAALTSVRALGHREFLELGPADPLARMGRAALPDTWWTASPVAGTDGVRAWWEAASALYRRGFTPRWQAAGVPGRRVPLPGYPFERVRYAAPALPEPAPGGLVVPQPVAGGAAPAGSAGRAAPVAGDRPAVAATGPAASLAGRQLAAMGRMFDDVHELMTAQLRVLSGPSAVADGPGGDRGERRKESTRAR
ncbi:type I polyketide synthase [Streptomyces leeuwenhoekii]|uniref:type I polyketide synthase n=1 Tax=Streptomyces leeuwenhoekii TaxID=1437453 RepID=UPI00065C78AD|nr:type I polyketide synthase [Streptomyces leeuwenhoekii]